MAKQTFTTGQVLTAAQMTSLQQTAMGGGSATAKTASYVLTAADAGTTVIMNAAGATTITVNTALFAAGDTVNIQNIGAGICTVTAGTATVNTAGSLALNQYEGGVLYFRSASAATFFDYVQAGATIPLTTKGDLLGFDTAVARIPIGTDGQVLTADSVQGLGLKWATPGAAAKSYTLLNAGGTALTGAATITVTGVTGDDLMILVTGASSVSASSAINIRFNTIATSKYGNMGVVALGGATYAVTNLTRVTNNVDGATVVAFAVLGSDAASTAAGYCQVFGAKSTGPKPYSYAGSASAGSGNGQNAYVASGVFTDTAAITSVSIISGTGDFDAGTIYVYEAQ